MPRKPRDPYRRFLVEPRALRWRCDPREFDFRTTDEITDCPIDIIGQDRAQRAVRLGLTVRGDGYNIFAVGEVGSGRSTVVRRLMGELEGDGPPPDDLAYVHDFEESDRPRLLVLPAGRGAEFADAMVELVVGLQVDLRRLFDSVEYRKRRDGRVEAAAIRQRELFKAFEKKVQDAGFALVEIQMGPLVRPQLMPKVDGEPIELDKLEERVDAGTFERDAFERIREQLKTLGGELETLGKTFRNLDREMRRSVVELDRRLARPIVEEAAAEVGASFAVSEVGQYLAQVVEDVVEHLDAFRQTPDPGDENAVDVREAPRYRVNVIVDNAHTAGRPIIRETAPSHRNLFGTIERTRTPDGESGTDHTRIRAGSLIRANGGFLILDALDVLVEPGVWPALKRSLRNRIAEIQVFDALQLIAGASLKPRPVPIDVKVVMIGTRRIWSALSQIDEDFAKIFKVKAEFARHTPLTEFERHNYACFVNKKVGDCGLPPFHRDAVAAVVEQGARMAGDRRRLTTRFTEVADVIREAGYWAMQDDAKVVRELHVERAIAERIHRVSMTEELLRERLADGEIVVELEGEAVGQVNGLAVLDTGDHRFGQPSRITATTAVGRAGIIDVERQADMSGPTHTKGVLIISGFLRSRFAQDKPLALTASICFEQNYGGIEGDSASSTELYALLSSLAGVPIRQGIAVTGSVDQRGLIQPIGGVNEKIEGFFDLCRVRGLTGEQGVMIPTRNLEHLMLRKDVVAEVRAKRFHVWAVSTIEEGLAVLTGSPAGEPLADGGFTSGSVYARVDDRLRRLTEEVGRHGVADLGQPM